MLPKHNLLSQVPLRADSIARRLQSTIWQEIGALRVEATETTPGPLSWKEATRRKLTVTRSGTHWGKLFDQRWCRVVLPRKTDGNEWLNWRDEGEATLYIKGAPYFGFDVGHRHCRLPSGIEEVWVECNCVQSAIWHPESRGLSREGSRFDGASLVERNDDAWNAYHDVRALLDVALVLRCQEDPSLTKEVAPGHTQERVERHSPAYRRMLRSLEDAADAIDTGDAAAGRKVLAKAFRELRTDRALMRAVLTGHAHIDLVWLWPERIGELKAVHTFATVNRLMDEYPEFRFAYSQPASYEAVQRRAPNLYASVLKRIRSGKWQATGAMYVESDTLLACGEALLRSFLVGHEEFTKINGKPSVLTWLPDVFGYSACLPQMMRLTGVEYFFTTKMTWNLVNRFPYSSFVWRGNDGSEVVAHVTQDCGYNSSLDASQLKASSWGHQQGDIHTEYLLPVGYGDGGGGPSAEMCERARRLSALPGMPGIQWDQPESFFKRLSPLKERLPVVQGECYLEGHRGTFTTHGAFKAAFRNLERVMQVSEAVACVTGRDWDRRATWKRLIFSQFHDFIPGSSVWDVYLQAIPEFESLAVEQTRLAIQALEKKSGDDCAFNPHAVEVERWIKHPRTGKRVRVKIPALGGMPIDQAIVAAPERVVAGDREVSNGLTSFRWDRNGWIDRLKWDGIDAALAGPLGQLIAFHDKPARYEAWDIDRHTLTDGIVCDSAPEIETFREAHRAGVRIRRSIGMKSSADVRIYLEAGSSLVHFEIDLDWHEPCTLLKLIVPTRHLAPGARFGAPYGSVVRPQVMTGPVSEAMWEVPFSRWLAVFDERESDGLFAVTESKYGATVRDGTIGISLVRSPHAVGYDGMRIAWPPHLSRVKGPSEFTDIGRHTIRLAIGRYHDGLKRAEHPASLADTLFTDAILYGGRKQQSSLAGLHGGETLIPAWAQPIDAKAWLLRLHEVAGQRGKVNVRCTEGWSASRCDARGQSAGTRHRNANVTFSPYEIVSVRISRTR